MAGLMLLKWTWGVLAPRLKLLLILLAGVVAGLFSVGWGLLAALACSQRAVRVAVALDQAANAAIGGSEDETVSSRAAKGARAGRWHWCILCRLLDWIDPGHCEKSIEPDEGEPTPAERRGFSFGGGMAVTVKRKAWLFLGALLASALAFFAFRNLAGVAVAAVLSGLSASALASSAGAAGGKAAGVHFPAFIGAFAGSLLLWVQLRGRPLVDKVVLVLGAFLAAFYGGQLAVEVWPKLGAGGVGVAGTVCACVIVPLLEAVLALLKDVAWIKRLISIRLGAKDAAPSPSAGTVDNPVNDSAAG
ncbi:hypothetical protein NK214_06345 [Chromobacterium sp. S0633]|uniref:hypothetical protein n=1 Tax=Chromobacterium sp. S0633 TaxID=2957805 RepID=UPI00209D0D82|nr:hypothetical protein [Chromobacterium sp. S0633]MCP1289808.1 hypothetical protein [Chromobacterium sp. S0633]